MSITLTIQTRCLLNISRIVKLFLHRNKNFEKLLTIFHIGNPVKINSERIQQFFSKGYKYLNIFADTIFTDEFGNIVNASGFYIALRTFSVEQCIFSAGLLEISLSI